MSTEEKQRILRALWREKMHVEPRALALSPEPVRSRFEHQLAPADWASRMLEPLPAGWLAAWAQSPRGHLVFSQRASAYRPGPQPWRDGVLVSVCTVSLADLIARDERCHQPAAMIPILHLCDHLLGSEAEEGAPRLSDGAGITPPLEHVGRAFQRIHALGYGHEALRVASAADYLAATLCLFLANPRELSVLDPLVYRLYARTLFSDRFWERATPRPR